MAEYDLKRQTTWALNSDTTSYQLWNLESDAVMINLMCQLDQTTECPNIWSNNILDVSVKVFLDKINI